jgi:hypothetical protein
VRTDDDSNSNSMGASHATEWAAARKHPDGTIVVSGNGLARKSNFAYLNLWGFRGNSNHRCIPHPKRLSAVSGKGVGLVRWETHWHV